MSIVCSSCFGSQGQIQGHCRRRTSDFDGGRRYCSPSAWWSPSRKRAFSSPCTMPSRTHCLHPAFLRRGRFLPVYPALRRTQWQTKHGAYVGVIGGAAVEECQVTGGVGVAAAPWPPRADGLVGSLLTRTEDRRGRGREPSDWEHRSKELKGRLVSLFSPNSRTIPQFKSRQRADVCVLGFVCWHAF